MPQKDARLWLKAALALSLTLPVWAVAQTPTNIQVTNGGTTLQDAIQQANGYTLGPVTIEIMAGTFTDNTISLTQQMVIGLNEANTSATPGYFGLSIIGNGAILDMQDADRAFFIASGAISISNLTIANGHARGGSATLGGGGGAGLGGAIFIADASALADSSPNLALPTAVTLTDISFSRNEATGGAGGQTSTANLTGGGGGMGGNGGSGDDSFQAVGGGGGGFGNGSNGGSGRDSSGSTGAMTFTSTEGTGPGGAGGNVDNYGNTNYGGANGGGGGSGGDAFEADQGGGGGGINGGGGNGGFGGAGGFGGGGGAGVASDDGAGAGGFGGGGGAGFARDSGDIVGGAGGFGGGGGAGTSGDGAGGFAASSGSHGEGFITGGNGAGLGGAIFVMGNTSLTINSGSFSNNRASGVTNNTTSSAYGGDIFLGSTVTYSVDSGDTVSLNLGGAGNSSAANIAPYVADPNVNGGIIVDGGGTISLSGSNYYSGSTTIRNGALSLSLAASEQGTTSVIVGQQSGDNATLTFGSNTTFTLAGFDLDTPADSSDTAIQLAQDAGSTGAFVIGGDGSAVINARFINGGAGDASVSVGLAGEFHSTLTGSLSLIANTGGTTTLAPSYGDNTFTGATTISSSTLITSGSHAALANTSLVTVQDYQGTLVLGQSDGINDAAGLHLAGATLSIGIDNATETMGHLGIYADSSVIDFNDFAATLTFSSLSVSSEGTLYIYNFDFATDTINILGSFSGDLTSILFYSGEATGYLGTGSFDGIALVPEPSTWALLLLGTGLLITCRSRRHPTI